MKALALIALALALEGGFLLTVAAGPRVAVSGPEVKQVRRLYPPSSPTTASTAAVSSPPAARTSGASGGS
jgi:hypothetical protein